MTRRAFTLIELLVVMAISALLLVIIAVPVVQGFNLTRFAQGFADAQDRGRALIRRLEREIGNSAGVRDNSGIRGALNLVVPGQNGAPEPVLLQGVKMDLLKPAEGDPTRGPSGAFINPDTGREDPTLQAPKGQVNLPAVPGLTLVRYFVGLRDPFRTYFNGYDGLLMPRDGGRDNLFVLFRAEIQPYIWVNVNGQQRRVVNAAYFFDQDYDNDPDTTGPLLDDPDFFRTDVPLRAYAQVPPGWRQPGAPDKATMVRNWLTRGVVQTEVSRYDMIAPVFDRVSRRVIYDGNVPRLVSLVRFQPTRVTSEPAESQTAVRSGEEGDNAVKYGPDVYRTQFGAWSNLLMRVWPSEYPTNWGPGAGQADAGDLRARWGGGNLINGSPAYIVARTWTDGVGIERFSVFGYDPNTASGPDTTDGVELFDVSRYLEVRRIDTGFTPRPYAFTEAVNAANGRSGWLASPLWRENFVPSVPDPKSGKVLAAFESREVGTDATVPYDLRVPTFGQQTAPANLRFGVRVSPYDTGQPLDYNPNNDPDVGTGNWYDQIFEPVNRKFNKLWRDFPTLAPGLSRDQYVKRYIDLRTCPQPDGAFGALDPRNNLGRAAIVPGSEVVIGPDQRPGPNYGRPVRYTRVTQKPVGRNQYYVNYVDQPEPDWAALGFNLGGIGGNPYDPRTYTTDSFVQAVLQPQYRAGYVELNSNFGEPIPSGYLENGTFVPAGNIYVTYRFQFTEPNDVVAVDYDSSQVMEVNLTVRNYPQSSVPFPQSITVRGSAEVRNFLR